MNLQWIYLIIFIISTICGSYYYISGRGGIRNKLSFTSKLKPRQRSATSIDSLEILNGDHITGCPNGCDNELSNYESKTRWPSKTSVLTNQD